MTTFLVLALLAMLIVFGVDIGLKRRDVPRKDKHP